MAVWLVSWYALPAMVDLQSPTTRVLISNPVHSISMSLLLLLFQNENCIIAPFIFAECDYIQHEDILISNIIIFWKAAFTFCFILWMLKKCYTNKFDLTTWSANFCTLQPGDLSDEAELLLMGHRHRQTLRVDEVRGQTLWFQPYLVLSPWKPKHLWLNRGAVPVRNAVRINNVPF